MYGKFHFCLKHKLSLNGNIQILKKSGKTLKRLRWVSQIYVIHIILLFIWIMCYKFVCDNKL